MKIKRIKNGKRRTIGDSRTTVKIGRLLQWWQKKHESIDGFIKNNKMLITFRRGFLEVNKLWIIFQILMFKTALESSKKKTVYKRNLVDKSDLLFIV